MYRETTKAHNYVSCGLHDLSVQKKKNQAWIALHNGASLSMYYADV